MVGIELGGFKSLVTRYGNQGIECIENDLSSSEIQTLIGFDEKYR